MFAAQGSNSSTAPLVAHRTTHANTLAMVRKLAALALGTAAAFQSTPTALPRQTALRAAEAPEEAATPSEEGPDAATVAAGANFCHTSPVKRLVAEWPLFFPRGSTILQARFLT